MMFKKILSNKQVVFISPWLMAASIGLMTLIVAVFAVNNLKREMHLLNTGLHGRGESLARFVGAGTRASMMHGMQGALHTQSLIEQASVDPGILYIAVIDSQGNIMAHSDSTKVGGVINREIDKLSKLALKQEWHIILAPDSKNSIFEVVSDFAPFRHGREVRRARGGNWGGNRSRRVLEMRGAAKTSSFESKSTPQEIGLPNRLIVKRKVPATFVEVIDDEIYNKPYDWCTSFATDDDSWSGSDFKILVGLDMKEQDKISRQARLHIVSLSVILLLVGLGGWFTLFIMQNYRASQQALKDIKAFADLLVLKLPVGVVATDQSGKIKTFNSAIAKMVGRNSAESIGHYPAELLPSVLADFFDNLNTDEEVLEKDIEIRKSGKRTLIARVSSVPIIDNKGHFVGRVLLVYDLTELKKLEKEVTKHDRLVTLGKMAAGVAHEVRNPLSSIKGFATLLGTNFEKGSDGQKSVELLVNEVERLNRSITELLNYSRPLPLKKTNIVLKEIVNDSLRLMSGDAAELGVELDVNIEDGLPEINIDADRINQVLLNLYLNAFQAMSTGGRLVVEVSRATDTRAVQIEIIDNGCGISKEVIGRLTDPYFTTKTEGTGLGLALAHKIIDEHDGSIKFHSNEGEGTTVTVELPI